MLKTLIKKQLLELSQTYTTNKKTGKKRSKSGIIGIIVLYVFIFISAGMAFFSMSMGVGMSALNKGNNWYYFAIMSLLSIALGVFGSVFSTYASVYLPKDNDFLLSLPIPPFKLLISRMVNVYIIAFVFGAWIWIPSIIVYWILTPISVLSFFPPLILTFIIPLFDSVLSCILGFLVALVARKTKGKAYITVIFSLAIFALYYFVYFKIVGSFSEIMQNLEKIASVTKSYLHYIFFISNAADGNILFMLITITVTLALGALCLFVMSKTFLKLSTSKESTQKKIKGEFDYTKKEIDNSLLNRELKHFTSVSVWMLNGGLGLVILPVLAVTSIIFSSKINEYLVIIAKEAPFVMPCIPILILFCIILIISTNIITPASVSIEGKSLWIVQSLPLDPYKVIHAKECMAVLLNSVPMIITVIIEAFVFKLEIYEAILLLLAAWIYIWVVADFGLFMNLNKPNLTWSNETVIVKQGVAVTVTLFGGWLFCFLLAGLGYFICQFVSAALVLVVLSVILLVLWFVLHKWLKNKGAKILAEL